MKTHRDLLAALKSNGMRITPARRRLLQFILDNKSRQISTQEVQDFLGDMGVDRSSIYRNLDLLQKLDIIQEINLPNIGKRFQYVFDRRVHHFYICKSCGKSHRVNPELFENIEKALQDVHGFSKTNLSVVFYGRCSKCTPSQKSSRAVSVRDARSANRAGSSPS